MSESPSSETNVEKRRVRSDMDLPPLPPIGVHGYESGPPVYNFCRSLARFGGNLFYDLKVYGEENVPLTGGVLLVSNHQSYVDPIFIAAKLPRVLAFLAKSELFDPPGFGWLIRNCNAFPVKQGKGDVGAMKKTIELLQDGKAILVFPEGSRTEDGKLQEIAAGAALVVKRAKVPVVPLVIDGAFKVWPRHRKLPRTGPVTIRFGKPMWLHQYDSREIVSRIGESFRELLSIPSPGTPGEGDDMDSLAAALVAFRRERDWEQFHNPKDQALSLVLEAAELLELTQWKNGGELAAHLAENREAVADELADVVGWCLLIAHDQGIDLADACRKKLAKNIAKYPAEKVRGSARKYTEYKKKG